MTLSPLGAVGSNKRTVRPQYPKPLSTVRPLERQRGAGPEPLLQDTVPAVSSQEQVYICESCKHPMYYRSSDEHARVQRSRSDLINRRLVLPAYKFRVVRVLHFLLRRRPNSLSHSTPSLWYLARMLTRKRSDMSVVDQVYPEEFPSSGASWWSPRGVISRLYTQSGPSLSWVT